MTYHTPSRNLDKLEIGDIADLAQLANFPGWTLLHTHYSSLIDKQKRQWGDALYKGTPPSESEVAFKAGFWEGVLAVLDTPSQAETRLTRELQRRKEAK